MIRLKFEYKIQIEVMLPTKTTCSSILEVLCLIENALHHQRKSFAKQLEVSANADSNDLGATVMS